MTKITTSFNAGRGHFGVTLGLDDDRPLITVRRDTDIISGAWRTPEVNWSAVGAVDRKYAADFKELMAVAVSWADVFDDCEPKKWRMDIFADAGGDDRAYFFSGPDRDFVDRLMAESIRNGVKALQVVEVDEFGPYPKFD